MIREFRSLADGVSGDVLMPTGASGARYPPMEYP
jgi:hypothetical protein